MSQAQKTRLFVMGYLHMLGANIADEGATLRVELTPEQLAELEGRTGPRWGILDRQEEVNSVIYLAFHPADAQNDQRAELIAPGSHRLEQMLASAHRQGKVTKCTIVPHGMSRPDASLHHTCLLIHIRVVFEGRNRREQLLAVGVDLVDGGCRPELARLVEKGITCQETPENIADNKLSPEEAFELAKEYVAGILNKQDDGWAREALLALAAERRALLQYYAQERPAGHPGSSRHTADRNATDDPDSGDTAGDTNEMDTQALRLGEIDRRCRPRAIARPVLCALVYVPSSALAATATPATAPYLPSMYR